MEIPTLIYCADGNIKYVEIALRYGFKFGARLPSKNYFPIYFADQDWKKPNRELYIKAIAKERPHTATVLDLEYESQFNEVMSWAEGVSKYVKKYIVIIPKCDIIDKIPKVINNKEILLGYSVPTTYGKTSLSLKSFNGRKIHVLGGSPIVQMDIYVNSGNYKVVSIDGNYINKMCQYGSYFDRNGKRRQLKSGKDSIYKAFELSCKNTMWMWKNLDAKQLHLF